MHGEDFLIWLFTRLSAKNIFVKIIRDGPSKDEKRPKSVTTPLLVLAVGGVATDFSLFIKSMNWVHSYHQFFFFKMQPGEKHIAQSFLKADRVGSVHMHHRLDKKSPKASC